MGSNSGNITFISKRKEYDCNYFYLLISRIIPLNCRRGGCGRRLVKLVKRTWAKCSINSKMKGATCLICVISMFVGDVLILQMS